jgi:putative NIF3 family GTP cyclohydrolase 1 type 2
MNIRIQDVIDSLTVRIGEIPNVVDRLISGNPLSDVTGIVVAFMPTRRVLEKAWVLGANMVIAHEGAFYRHYDKRDSFFDDETVHSAKKRFIDYSGIAIYRFHDGIHRYRPDGIMEGVLHELGWQEYAVEHLPAATVVNVPDCTVGGVAEHVKGRLGLASIRAVGDLSMPCKRIGLLVGNRGGGEHAIPLFERHGLDLLIYGEGPEWETPEYVRDAVDIGQRKALLVLGHLESEQPGMKLLADRLGALFPSVPVHFCPVEPVFRLV